MDGRIGIKATSSRQDLNRGDFTDIYTVSFFGHRRIENSFRLEEVLEDIICRLLWEKEYVEFLVGRDGDFDQLVSSTVKRCKRKVGDHNSALIWIQPYPKAEYLNDEESFHNYYDEIEICETSASAHFKAAIQIRNRSLVDRSHLAVFFVEQKHGGAYQTMRYAEKKKLPLINLWETIHQSPNTDQDGK